MGLATARIVCRDHALMLCDVRAERLEQALAALSEAGIEATPFHGDVTDRDAVSRLFETATTLGPIASVIHTAGVSPSMGDADYIMTTNALGTLHVNEVFFTVAGQGAAIVNVASMASHMLPDEIVPTRHFDLAFTDEARFLAEMLTACDRAGWGHAEEMAELFAFCASDRAAYLVGADILNDGGVIASMRERAATPPIPPRSGSVSRAGCGGSR